MLKKNSNKRSRPKYEPDYPLQGSTLDLPIAEVLAFSKRRREKYIDKLLVEFAKIIKKNEMALKKRVPFRAEMRDLRKLVRLPYDRYLFLDELTYKRNVLGKGSPGGTHTYWSRTLNWQMATNSGDLPNDIAKKNAKLVKKLNRFLDSNYEGVFSLNRSKNKPVTTIQAILSYLQVETHVGTAFPPFHARFLAEQFLPYDADSLIIDPCAGWGGRLLGSLCVKRNHKVTYIGVDPEKRNEDTYENLLGRVRKYLKREISGERDMTIYYRPFEDWIISATAKRYMKKANLVVTSPPYFAAEVYNTENKKQSANRYKTYSEWRDKFYYSLVKGAYDLLKPGGVFVLNISDVSSAKTLEKDARKLAREVGFKNAGFYKLAMSVAPGIRNALRHRVVVNGVEFKHEPVFCFRR